MAKVLFVFIIYIHLALGCLSQTSATDDYIRFYQKELSYHKNSRCSMYPSCSRYAQIVFSEYPFFQAIQLNCDRLIRCSHDTRFYDITYKYGFKSLIDLPNGKSDPCLIHNRFINPYTDMVKPKEGRAGDKLFISNLINHEYYQLALLEVERCIFYGSKDTFYYKSKLLCLRGLKDYEKGIFEYEVSFPDELKRELSIQYQVALLYYCLGNYEKVLAICDNMNTYRNIDGDMLNEILALCATTQARLGLYNEATQNFISIDGQQKSQNYAIVQDLKSQKYKSPALAKSFSIIPGAGYLYTKHTGSALTAFMINCILGYATYTSLKKGNYGAAGLFGFFSLSFYIGNINGAGRSANRYNQRIREQNIRKLETINHIFIN